MIWLLALGIGAITAAGVFLAMSRELLRIVVGISLMAAAANLVVFASGRPGVSVPPVIPAGLQVLGEASAPLPQALVLTAIVIGFSLTCFSLVVVLAITQRARTNDSRALRTAEPVAEPDGAPALESTEEDEA